MHAQTVLLNRTVTAQVEKKSTGTSLQLLATVLSHIFQSTGKLKMPHLLCIFLHCSSATKINTANEATNLSTPMKTDLKLLLDKEDSRSQQLYNTDMLSTRYLV